ncbi:ASDURF protein [Rhinophrynus dorsalis]
MSEDTTRRKEDVRSWTEQQQEEFVAKFREQKVVVDELSNLKKDRKVYKQQPNSNIFFLADRTQTFSECKKTLDDMKHTHQDLETFAQTQVKR